MVLDRHAERSRALGDLLADAAHAEDPEDLVLGIVAQLAGASPALLAERGVRDVDPSQGAEEEEDGHVCGGGVDGFGGVRDEDVVGCGGGDVDVVVAGAVVADVF